MDGHLSMSQWACASPLKRRSLQTTLLTFFLAFTLFTDTAFAQDSAIILRTYRVRYASVLELEPIVRPLLSQEGTLSVDERTNSMIARDTMANIKAIDDTVMILDTRMPSRTFCLNYAEPQAMAERIRRILGPLAASVEPDTRTHSVFVMTTEANLERIEPLVRHWDKQGQQVSIQADILDVSSAKLKELGIDWELRLGYSGGDNEAVFSVGTGRASPDNPSTGGITLGTPTINVPAVFDPAGNLVAPPQVIPGSDFSAAIEALVEDSSTRTLSRPRIMVLDGHPARFEVATLEPYANTHYNAAGAASSLDIQFLDIGIILETVPHINEEGYILLDIRPEVSTLVRDEFFDTTIIPDEGGAITNSIRVPVKRQNRATTTVMVRDRQTIVIGGLRTHQNFESQRKVPLLGDVPILGIPFRSLNQSDDDREIVIFITPEITTGGLTSPESRRLQALQPRE